MIAAVFATMRIALRRGERFDVRSFVRSVIGRKSTMCPCAACCQARAKGRAR